jgi:TRAP-type C4-dicarboxylate transport system permease small subunit
LDTALAWLDRLVAAALAIVRIACIFFSAGIFLVVIYAVFARYVLTQLPFFSGRVPSQFQFQFQFEGYIKIRLKS